jgi:hypothetical protein
MSKRAALAFALSTVVGCSSEPLAAVPMTVGTTIRLPAMSASFEVSPTIAPSATSLVVDQKLPKASRKDGAPTPAPRSPDAPVVIGGYMHVGSLTLYGTNVYFIGYGPSNGAILSAPTDASHDVTELWIPMEDPANVVATRVGVFYNDVDTHAVFRLSKIKDHKPTAIADADDDSLGGDATGAFFTHNDQLFVIEGGNARHLAAGVGSARSMTVDADAARWIRDDTHMIQRFDRKKKVIENLGTALPTAQFLSVSQHHVYYADGGTLNVIDEQAVPHKVSTLLDDPAILIRGIAVDEEYVYLALFPATFGGPSVRIVRVPKVSGPSELISLDVSNPEALAVDAENLYFTDHTTAQNGAEADSVVKISKTPRTISP